MFPFYICFALEKWSFWILPVLFLAPWSDVAVRFCAWEADETAKTEAGKESSHPSHSLLGLTVVMGSKSLQQNTSLHFSRRYFFQCRIISIYTHRFSFFNKEFYRDKSIIASQQRCFFSSVSTFALIFQSRWWLTITSVRRWQGNMQNSPKKQKWVASFMVEASVVSLPLTLSLSPSTIEEVGWSSSSSSVFLLFLWFICILYCIFSPPLLLAALL